MLGHLKMWAITKSKNADVLVTITCQKDLHLLIHAISDASEPADLWIRCLLFSENAFFPGQNIAIPPFFVGHFPLKHNHY